MPADAPKHSTTSGFIEWLRGVLERLRNRKAVDPEVLDLFAGLPTLIAKAMTDLQDQEAELERLLEHARRHGKRVPIKLRREIEQLRAQIRRGPPKA